MFAKFTLNTKRLLSGGKILLLIIFVYFSFELKGQPKKVPSEELFTLGCLKNAFFNVDINDATAAIKVWGQSLQKRIKVQTQFDLKLFDNINDMLNYPGKDNLGFVLFNSVDYLKYKSKLTVYPSFVPVDCEEYIILAKPEKYKNLKSLEGKNLGLIKMDFNPIPSMWLDVLLGKNKSNLKEKYFGAIKEVNNESQLILSLFFDQYDACLVSKRTFETMIELNPQVGKSLSILAQSPCYLVGLTCLTKNSIKFAYIDKLIDALIKLSNYPEGKQILIIMKTENVREFVPGDLNEVEELLKQFQALRQRGKK